MTRLALAIGSFLMAFSPLLASFYLVVYPKAQLVILVTTAAFLFLLSATATGIVWRVLDVLLFGWNTAGDATASSSSLRALGALVPAVLCQFMGRCAYVALYHQVEAGISQALDTNGAATNTELAHSIAKFRLVLNDASAAIASAVGYGGMHVVLLFGSLWASEVVNDAGVLVQDFCPAVPSLAATAVLAHLQFVLQGFWMLFTFYGMRRRLVWARGDGAVSSGGSSCMGNSRAGGNTALLFTFVSQAVAASCSVAHMFRNGCWISIPATLGLVVVTAVVFWAGCGRQYLYTEEGRRHHEE